MTLLLLFALTIAFVAIIFALQNNIPVVIQFLSWQHEESLALVLLSTLAIGVLVGILVAVPSLVRRGWQTSRARRQADSLESQLQGLQLDATHHHHRTQQLRSSYQRLLHTLNLLDPTTELLSARSLPTAVNALCTIPSSRASAPTALGLLLIQVAPDSTDVSDPIPPVIGAIANQIKHETTIDTWLYSDGQTQIMATLIDKDIDSVKAYAHKLHQTLSDFLKADHNPTSKLDLSLGGAYTQLPHPAIRYPDLLRTAQTALQQAKQSRQKVHIDIVEVSAQES